MLKVSTCLFLPNNTNILNLFIIISVFPSLIANNSGQIRAESRQVKSDHHQASYYQEMYNIKRIADNSQKFMNKEEKMMPPITSILKNQTKNDNEIIDLTRTNNQNKIESRNHINRRQLINSEVKTNRSFIPYEINNESQNKNYIYYLNNDNFGGY